MSWRDCPDVCGSTWPNNMSEKLNSGIDKTLSVLEFISQNARGVSLADIVKVFPGELLGPQFIKAVHGPLPQAPLMPTGGVSADNVGEWFAAGAVALGVGGSLTAGAKTGDYAAVTAAARLFVEKIKAARNG